MLALPPSLWGEPGARKKWLQYLNILPALFFPLIKNYCLNSLFNITYIL